MCVRYKHSYTKLVERPPQQVATSKRSFIQCNQFQPTIYLILPPPTAKFSKCSASLGGAKLNKSPSKPYLQAVPHYNSTRLYSQVKLTYQRTNITLAKLA